MGLKDNVTKEYMKDDGRFADLFNYFMYDGNSVIKPESLEERDTTEIINLIGEDNKLFSKQEFRDLLKQSVVKYDDKAYYLLLGIENQSEIHCAMPVKNCIYDALNYGTQAAKIAKQHRVNKDTKGAEFLSGFTKEDKLVPVITLVILWNSGIWDGPRSLHEMMCIQDETILKFVPDYKLNLVVPGEIEDFEKFKTERNLVLELISAKDSYKKIETLMDEKRDRYSNVDMESTRVLEVCTGVRFTDITEEGGINVCKGIDDLKRMASAEGKIKGSTLKTIELVCKKLKKGMSALDIADVLEEELSVIEKIVSVAKDFAPEYDVDAIFEKLMAK